MRTESSLAKLLWPKARRRILGLLLARPDEERHLRDIARLADLASSTVQREVPLLREAEDALRREVNAVVMSVEEFGERYSSPPYARAMAERWSNISSIGPSCSSSSHGGS